MFGIGGNELLIIGVFALIIFGPDKIPEIARTAGKAIQMFKRAQQDVEHVIKTEIYDPIQGKSSESKSTPSPTLAADKTADASAIWATVGDTDDEEGEEE